MNIERETKVEITVPFNDLVAMLRAKFPEEFLLNQQMVYGRNTSLELLGSVLRITVKRASQGPAEIDFNRMQRNDGAGYDV